MHQCTSSTTRRKKNNEQTSRLRRTRTPHTRVQIQVRSLEEKIGEQFEIKFWPIVERDLMEELIQFSPSNIEVEH